MSVFGWRLNPWLGVDGKLHEIASVQWPNLIHKNKGRASSQRSRNIGYIFRSHYYGRNDFRAWTISYFGSDLGLVTNGLSVHMECVWSKNSYIVWSLFYILAGCTCNIYPAEYCIICWRKIHLPAVSGFWKIIYPSKISVCRFDAWQVNYNEKKEILPLARWYLFFRERIDHSAILHKMKSSLIRCPYRGGCICLYLGGATVGLYQNGGYDEQRNEHIDTNRYACTLLFWME